MLCYLAAGFMVSFYLAGRAGGLAGSGTGALITVQALVQICVFLLLTWFLGRRVLRFSWVELGWVKAGRGRWFFLGFACAAALAISTMLLGVAGGGAHWLHDTGSIADYARAVAVTTLVLAPAALAEEVAFRGFPLVALEGAMGRGTAIVALSALFAGLHAWNPSVTGLGLGNIALAGVLLSLAFFTPGGMWTAWGAHLGWNASIAALDAPVSGLPFTIPLINFDPGSATWLTGGAFGPEGGVAATLVLGLGAAWLARYLRKEGTA